MYTTYLLQLKPIEYLLGTTAKLGDIIVLGMLTQLREVCYKISCANYSLDFDDKHGKNSGGKIERILFVHIQ